MKYIKIILGLITAILIGATIYVNFIFKQYLPDPIYQYSNSEHSINYFFNLSNISVVLDKDDNVLRLVNKDNESAIILEPEMDPSVYVNRGLVDWIKVPTENNTVLLVPPKQCRFFEVNTISKNNPKGNFVLADIINSWNQCVK